MVTRIQDRGLARFTAALAAIGWWMQWGTGSGANAAANVVTTTGTTEARAAGTTSQVTTTATDDTLQIVATLTAAGTPTISELGVFDAAGAGSPPAGGNMDLYADFSGLPLEAGDSLTFTFLIDFANA